MTQHSAIGPSALHRLLACPGSHQLSKSVPATGGGSSSYAAEGTVAHQIVECALREDGLLESGPVLGDTIHEDGHDIIVDQDMVDGADHMIGFCDQLKTNADRIWVEERVDLGHLWDGTPPEPIFGTVDFSAYHPKVDTLHVVDFKYGRLPVSPYDNHQAYAYGTGAVHELGAVPKWVVLTIIQPRGMDGQIVKSSLISGLDLMIWAEETLIPGVDALYEPDPLLATGDHCRFCPCKLVCPALHKLAQDTAKIEFPGIPPSPVTMDNDELALIMNQSHVLKHWFDEVQAEVSGRVERGETVPGWKLVPKRAARKWTDVQEVLNELNKHKYSVKGSYIKEVPLTPAQLERKDKSLYEIFVKEGLMSKQSSGSTLAPESDPREAVEKLTAKDDFDVV